jgi:hypothetical protein
MLGVICCWRHSLPPSRAPLPSFRLSPAMQLDRPFTGPLPFHSSGQLRVTRRLWGISSRVLQAAVALGG